ncbi:SDR family NAD(P)-dependent oxidoreductase [Peterkaempfera bronchialis]|uniref:SDR family NAD(P)-dependent oxidoreductase n=1 Tax=Peterkaempfera bronchialis TaxID=2126346 RepID=UPI003C303D91
MLDHHPRPVPVAVVAVGALLPGSPDPEGFWRAVVQGRDLITDVPPHRWLVEDHYDPDPSVPDRTYARRGAFLPAVDFDPMAFGILPNNLSATDSAQLLALLVAEQVLTEAGGDRLPALDRDRIGVVLGAAALPLLSQMADRLAWPMHLKALRESGVPEPEAQAICERIADQTVEWGEATFPGMLTNVVAGRIANRFDLHGLNHTTDAACASSLAALSTAIAELTLGRADLMLTGGVDTANDIGTYVCFSKTPALSTTGDCRPFSADADGTMLGEGLAMFALKRLADAERDGDRIYAVIRGVGTSSDGGGTAIYAPVPAGQAKALRRAYREAGYSPRTVGLVEAHGTGTKAGDAAEFAALREVFEQPGDPEGTGDGPDRQYCALGSVKSQIGHTKCAAGAAGLLKAVLALHHRVLPPTVKVERPAPGLDLEHSPFYLNTRARPWVRPADHPRRASVSSFGFGGSNFHVAVEEYVPDESGWGERARRFRSMPSELVLFAADTPEAVLTAAGEVDPDQPLAALARSSQQEFRPDAPARLAIVARDTADLAAKAAQAAAVIARRPDAPFAAPGIRYRTGAATLGRIGFLFPGQGSQHIGMGADLALHLPTVQRAWDRHGAREFDGLPLHRLVFPPPTFTDAERDRQQAALTATEWAQPALAAHSLALLDLLRALGLRPDCAAGHSFGELVALHAAGALDADGLLGLARCRGELMRDAALRTPGAMVAVTAPREQVEPLIADLPGVWLANHNAPEQVVLSGLGDAVDAAAGLLAGRGFTTRRLDTATAFHSPVVAAAGEPLAQAVRELRIDSPALPVYGNADASVYPAEPDQVRGRIAAHLASPVLFQAGIEAMYAAGVRTFVEVGPGTTLTGLVQRILGDRDHLAVALQRPGQDGVTALHEALGQLAVCGAALDHGVLWEEYAPAAKRTREDMSRMTVKIDGGNHGRPYPPPGGAAALPGPNPVPAPVSASVPVSAPGSAPASAAPVLPVQQAVDPGLLALIEETQRQTAQAHADYQRQTAEAHTDYQRQVTESHLAYLRMSESAMAALLGGPVAVPETAPAYIPAARAAVPVPQIESAVVMAPAPAVPVASAVPVAAPAAPATPDTPAAPAPSAPSEPTAGPDVPAPQDLERLILSVVAERTGYPVDILNLDMELAADLGIDSIKRVEILSVVCGDMGDLPQSAFADLGAARTLRQIADTVRSHLGITNSDTPSAATPPTPVAPAAPATAVRAALSRAVPCAVPAPAAGLAMAGLYDGPIAVTDDGTGVAQLVAEQLRFHGCAATVERSIPEDAAGVVLLDGLAPVDSAARAAAIQREAFRTAVSAAARPGVRSGVFVTVQDTGGDFGLGGGQGDRAWLGGLAGLARTAAKEWPEAAVKAIDCERGSREPHAVAAAIVGELLEGGPDLDVALSADGTRRTLRLAPAPLPATAGEPARIGPQSVIVATGGARGVTAAALRALAAEHRPHLVLLGRTPLTEEPPGLAHLTDEAALTRALAETRAPDDREPAPAPAALAAHARRILAVREIRETVAAIERAGSPVRYLAVDARDGAALSRELDRVRAEWGPVTGIVHGAGVLADKLIADKTDEQIDRVLSTKVDGLRALLDATVDDPLRLVCLFSSVAGLFGNAGQSDYAVANEVLGQVASVEQARRPGCLVRSIAWGPWQGGMVTPPIAALLVGEGVELIPVEAGADAFAAEVGGPASEARVCLAMDGGLGPMGSVGRAPARAELRIDADRYPYLADHAINGRPVLPLALSAEWFARVAAVWRPDGDPVVLRGLRVLRKVVLPEPTAAGPRLTVQGRVSGQGGQRALELELRGDGGAAHVRAVVPGAAAANAPDLGEPGGLLPPDGIELYDGHALFHGPRFHVVRSLTGIGEAGAVGELVGLRGLGWPGEAWRSDPAALDGALQLASLWALRMLGGAVLPMGIEECRLLGAGPLTGAARCVVRAVEVSGDRARCEAVVADESGAVRIDLRGVELVRRPS